MLVSFFYYPKWEQEKSEATISWDVSGYYWYLPAFIIYDDPHQLSFGDDIRAKYKPTPDVQQAFPHRSGKKIMKYSAGMAVQYLPFFLTAHVLAPVLGYPADGFSAPYQFAIQLGSVLFCFLGLWFFRKVLLEYFKDQTVAWMLLLYVIGTNYLNYSAIDGAMTHNWLFSWYAILLYLSDRFYKKPNLKLAALIGMSLGIMVLTRPTELIAVIIPLGWGITRISVERIQERIKFFWDHRLQFILAIAIMGSIGFIQLLYWKYIADEWLIYSYQDQGFNWIQPHFVDFIFSYRCGWLIYTPLMIFSFIGILALINRKIHTVPLLLFFAVNLYVVCAWNVWWYGGRAMVQSYPILAFPFAAFLESIDQNKIKKYLTWLFLALFTYANIWWTLQTHKDGLIDAFNMTEAYYWRVVGRYDVDPEVVKLYDTDELFEGERTNLTTIYSTNFENDTSLNSTMAIEGSRSQWVDAGKQFTPKYGGDFSPNGSEWVRATAAFHIPQKEWSFWLMPQLVLQFSDHGTDVKTRGIRLHRLLTDGSTKRLYIDVKIPNKPFDRVDVYLWNADGTKKTFMDELIIESYSEE